MSMAKDKIVNNLKVVAIMKSTGRTDAEIAKYCDVATKELIDEINQDDYLKEVYDNASKRVATEIEELFIMNIMAQLESGDNTDAKFYLERTTGKYSKKDNVNVTGGLTIDEIIRSQDNGEKQS